MYRINGTKQFTTKGYNLRKNDINVCNRNCNTNPLEENCESSAGDLLLSMVAVAYNYTPHKATGDGPFLYFLHVFDPSQPSSEMSQDE